MLSKIFKLKAATIILAAMFISSTPAHAYGPVMEEIHHTEEGARISIAMSSDGHSGTLTSRQLNCKSCSPEEYQFSAATILINQFGAERPIQELKSWSGSRAMFHVRKADNHIDEINILP